MQSIDLGQANIQPQQAVVAGSFSTISFTYTAGHPIDDSGYVMIAFRSVGDFNRSVSQPTDIRDRPQPGGSE